MIGSLQARRATRVALTVLLALVLMSCGTTDQTERPRSATRAARPITSVDPVRRLLEGDGIGSITFGQLRSTVIAGLERLHGPAHETIPGTCDFGRSPDWTGLNISGGEAHLTIDRGGTCSGSMTSISAVAPTSPQCAQDRVSSHEPILGERNPISVSSERVQGAAEREVRPELRSPSSKPITRAVGSVGVSVRVAAGVQFRARSACADDWNPYPLTD
jgi:hypothetical protein